MWESWIWPNDFKFSPLCDTGVLLSASFDTETVRKLEVKLCHQDGFVFVVIHHNSAAVCGDIKSPYLPRKPLEDCCTLASAEAQGFISLLPLSHPPGQGSAQAITTPPDAVFYICDVSGDTWPCTVLDGKHSTINSQWS